MISGLIYSACRIALECPARESTTCVQYIYDNVNVSTIYPWDGYYLIPKNTTTSMTDDTNDGMPPLDPKWLYADWAYWTARSYNFECERIDDYPSWMSIFSFVILVVGFVIMIVLLVLKCYSCCALRNAVFDSSNEIKLRHLV